MDETEPQEMIEALRHRADTLERELRETVAEAERRLIRAELKAEAVRAGMVDLDGLKLLDLSALRLSAGGDVGAAARQAVVVRTGQHIEQRGTAAQFATAKQARDRDE